MKNILLIECSPRPDSFSRRVAAAIIDKIKGEEPEVQIVKEDLWKNPPPHLSLTQLMAFSHPSPEGLTAEQKESMELSHYYIEQLRKADIIILSYPVWNFFIPSTLKAWLDQVVRSGLTFQYNSQGRPEGLLKNKKVYLALARGGVYAEVFNHSFERPYDFSILYLRSVLGYIGLQDVMVAKAEATVNPQAEGSAVEKAISLIE